MEQWSEVTTDAFVAEKADIGCAAVAGDHVYWVCSHDLAATPEGGNNNRMQDTGAAYRAKRKLWLVVSLHGVYREGCRSSEGQQWCTQNVLW